MTTAEERKAAEANGTEALKEVKSETASDGSSEDIPQYQKRNWRMGCLYISVAVVLGAALIGVLVYFSVTNALSSDDPETVAESLQASTTAVYSTTEGLSTTVSSAGNAGLTRDNNKPFSRTRGAQPPPPPATNPPTTQAPVKQARGLPQRPTPNPRLRQLPKQTTTALPTSTQKQPTPTAAAKQPAPTTAGATPAPTTAAATPPTTPAA